MVTINDFWVCLLFLADVICIYIKHGAQHATGDTNRGKTALERESFCGILYF